jgi:hypothetical protein
VTDPRWAAPRFDVTPDPRSRFFDPYNPDKPPLPPDDPAAHCFMHWVDGWQGYKGWHQFGDLLSVENPQWLANLGLTREALDAPEDLPPGELPQLTNLTLQEAVELSLIHSRAYQTQIENVYLAALDVTFERFQFGVRYLGTFGEPEAAGTIRFTPDGADFNDAAVGSAAVGVSQALPTGAQWMIELTNNTLWFFSGPNQTSTASVLSYSLTQPLWLGAGRKVVLEALTLTERQLLYAIRDLARFRQEFFTDIVASTPATSFLGLLQSYQLIINQRENLRRLEQQAFKLQSNAERGRVFSSAVLPAILSPDDPEVLAPPPYLANLPPGLQGFLLYDLDDERLRWRSQTEMTAEQADLLLNLTDDPFFQEAAKSLIRQVRYPVTSLDVLQIQTQYNNAVNQLRNSERSFQDNLDSYKIVLGLPPTIPVTLDVTLLDQFQLIAPVLLELEGLVDLQFSQIWGSSGPPEPDLIRGEAPEPVLDPETVLAVATHFNDLIRRVRLEVLELVRSELEEVRAIFPRRIEELEPDERTRFQFDFERDQRLFAGLESDFILVEEAGAEIEEALRAPRIDQEALRLLRRRIKDQQEDLVRLVRGLTVIEVGLRVELIELNPFDMTEEEALQLAMENRVDLMNARAFVMDARRQVEVAANRLQAALSLVAEGDFGTSDRVNPLSFNGDDSQIRFGMRFKAPLDMIAERNAYRAVLINYQREKREYMLFEDNVKQQVRRDLRGLTVQKRNLETSRGAVRRAAQQYDALNEQTDDPARAAQAATSTTGGLQGQNVLTALNSILQAQNQLVATWIDYERNRLNIYSDMGIMEIGPDGLWNDPFYRDVNNERSRPPENQIPVPPAPPLGNSPGVDGDGLGSGLDAPWLDGIVPAPEGGSP